MVISITTTAAQCFILVVLVFSHHSFVCGLHRPAVFIHSSQLKRVVVQVSNPTLNPHKFTSGSLSKRFSSTSTTEPLATDIDVKVFASTTAELLTSNTTDIVVIDRSQHEHQHQQQQQPGGGASPFDYGILLVCPMLWGKLLILSCSC